jgi:hypothetical protein
MIVSHGVHSFAKVLMAIVMINLLMNLLMMLMIMIMPLLVLALPDKCAQHMIISHGVRSTLVLCT